MNKLIEMFSGTPQTPPGYMPLQGHAPPKKHDPLKMHDVLGCKPLESDSFEILSNDKLALFLPTKSLSESASSFFQNLSSVPYMSSVISDLNATVVTTSLDVVKVFDPKDSTPFLAIGNLSVLTAVTAPIKMLDGFQTLKKTQNVAQFRLAIIGLMIGGLQFTRGLLSIAKDFSIDVAGAVGKTFPKAERGVAALMSSLGLVFYGVIFAYYGYKLSYHISFQREFSKIKTLPEAKKFLIQEYEKDPELLKLKMGDVAFRKIEKMMKNRAPKDKTLRVALAEQNEFDKMVGSVKWSMRAESLIRMVGVAACLVSATSIVLAAALTGTPALIATITLSLLGGALWLISDGFVLWNSLQNGEKNWKKVFVLAALVSASLLALNTILLFAGGVASAAVIGSMVVVWFGILATMAWLHHRNAVAGTDKVDKQRVSSSRF